MKNQEINKKLQAILKNKKTTPEQKILKLNKFIESNPDEWIAISSRAFEFLKLKKYKEALLDFDKLIQIYPDISGFFAFRGQCHYRLENYDKAIFDFEKAIELDPQEYESYFWCGLTFDTINKYDQAIQKFTDAIKLKSDDYLSFYGRGQSYTKIKNYNAAIDDFLRARELNQQDEDILDSLVNVYIELKEYDKVYEYFQKITGRVYDETAEKLVEVADHFSYKDEYNIALEILEKIRYNNFEQIVDISENIEWIKDKIHEKEKQQLREELEKRRNRKFTSPNELIDYFYQLFDTLRSNLAITYINLSNVILYLVFYKRISDLNYSNKEGQLYTPFLDLPRNLLWASVVNLENSNVKNHLIAALKDIQNSDRLLDDIFSEALLDLNRISQEELHKILYYLNDYYWSLDNISTEVMGGAFDHLMNLFFEWGRRGIESITPSLLKKLMVGLCNLNGDEYLYDPAVGSGGFFTEAKRQVGERNELKFHGIEINTQIFALCRINLILNGIYDADISNKDALLSKNDTYQNVKYDVAISDIPFGIKLNKEYQWNLSKYFPYPVTSSTSAFLNLMLLNLAPQGKLAIIVPLGFLFSKSNDTIIIKHLLDQDCIEFIIQLPAGIFSARNIKTAILFLNRNKGQDYKNKITFLSLSSNVNRYNEDEFQQNVKTFLENKKKWVSRSDVSRTIDLDEIKENDYNLDPSRYLGESYVIYQNFVLNKDENIQKIKSLVKKHFKGIAAQKSIKKEHQTKEKVKYVQVRHLSGSQTDFQLKVDMIDVLVADSNKLKFINKTTVLLSAIGDKLKPTLVEPTSERIAISPNVLALELDEKQILPEYFIQQLYNKTTLVQVDLIRRGSGIPYIRISDFLNIEIRVPSILEQNNLINEFRNIYAHQVHETISSYQSELAIAQQKAYQAVGLMKHNLGHKLGILINDFETLKHFIEMKAGNKQPLNFEDPVAPLFEGENDSAVENLSQLITRFYNKLQDTQHSLTRTKELFQSDRKGLPLSAFGLKSIMNDFMQTNYSNQKLFSFKITGKDPQVMLNQGHFLDAIEHIIKNAIQHGFINHDKDYLIQFDISEIVYDNRNYARIEYSNNGLPFPEGFGLEQLKTSGDTGGKTGNMGLGGFYINEVIEKHGGELQNLKSGPLGISFDILLPLAEEE